MFVANAIDDLCPASAVAAVNMDTDVLQLMLVEGHAILRDGLRALIENERGFRVVDSVGSCGEGLSRLAATRPDVVITDLVFPDRAGIGFISELKDASPHSRILVLTACNTEEHIRAALNAGATGFVLKESGSSELMQGIRSVASGSQFLCKAVWSKVLTRYLSQGEKLPDPEPAVKTMLTSREQEVLTYIARGHSNKLVARSMDISVKTVEKHRSNLMRKLNLHNTAAVTMFALRNGLIRNEELAGEA
jgi:DNA-binding NarL/FixJ family response regulator